MSRDSSNRYFDFLSNKTEIKFMFGSSLLGKKMKNRKVDTHTSFLMDFGQNSRNNSTRLNFR